MRCSVCTNEQVTTIDALLGSGTSIRGVSRLYGHSRSAVARHKQHAQVTGTKLSLIRGKGGPDGTDGPMEPLAAALALSKRARSDRELLKAAEAVRSATALQMKALGSGDPDDETLERLDSNIVESEDLYRRVGGFENELRGLAGHREAIRQRLTAVKPEKMAPTLIDLQFFATGTEPPEPPLVSASAEDRDIPVRFRDPERFDVRRMTTLSFVKDAVTTVKVYEAASGGLVWTKG